jgi:plastocyanin
MRKRALLRAIPVAAAAALVVPAVGTSATTAKIDVVGGNSYKIGKYAKSTVRFKKLVTVAKSGATVTITNKTNEPHTFSIVKKSDLPKTTKQVDGCFEGGPCGAIGSAHEFPEGDGPPAKPLVDADGDGGFNVAGDSVVFDAKGSDNATVKIKLTAKKGTTLSYLCGFHPWMQGKLKAN